MVQMHRRALRRTVRNSICSVFQTVTVSAAIPILFFLRFVLKGGNIDSLHLMPLELSTPALPSVWTESTMIRFLKSIDWNSPVDSDIVELQHCDESGLNWTTFGSFAFPLLNHSVSSLVSDPLYNDNIRSDMYEEFSLQLLEQYAMDHGLCDFSMYQPTVSGHTIEDERFNLELDALESSKRLAFVIVAFKDFAHLQQLVNAIHRPQHFIIVHLERRCPETFLIQVKQLEQEYANVVVVQFGTIVYRTDSVSHVNLRILRWITLDLQLPYTAVSLLDGSSYPLVPPDELTNLLADPTLGVYLGELTNNAKKVDEPTDQLLRQRRVYLTRQNHPKLNKRFPRSETVKSVLNAKILQHMHCKSTSGNSGIYSHIVVQDILGSADAMELFALSKYGCCCCLEERNWIAALSLVGHAVEALNHYSMFQVWGGETSCGSSMHNVVLAQNASLCYRTEDAINPHDFWGSAMWSHLSDAKRRGYVYARKFDSTKLQSTNLLDRIRDELWIS